MIGYSASGPVTCAFGYHEVNSYGTALVTDSRTVDRCGFNTCAIKAEWRITYGGQPQYGNDVGQGFPC